MPTQTNPNRAFALCGTSLGRLSNLHENSVEQFDTQTIWNALHPRTDVSMGIFYHDVWEDGKCYTQYTFPHMNKVHPQFLKIVQIADDRDGFWVRAHSGTLPAFSYIEPKWGYGEWPYIQQGNDYHPPTNVLPGEKLLCNIYDALRKGDQGRLWPKTLLIVTFDEHGGTYDHHSPPWGATNPGDEKSKNERAFTLFGVRVPTLLISPYVPEGTVFRSPTGVPYDHTSILATLLKWKGIDPAEAGLWKRVANAPTFEGVLSASIVNPGIDLNCPSDFEPPGEAERTLEGIPVADKRRIMLNARTIDDIKAMAEDWRAQRKAY